MSLSVNLSLLADDELSYQADDEVNSFKTKIETIKKPEEINRLKVQHVDVTKILSHKTTCVKEDCSTKKILQLIGMEYGELSTVIPQSDRVEHLNRLFIKPQLFPYFNEDGQKRLAVAKRPVMVDLGMMDFTKKSADKFLNFYTNNIKNSSVLLLTNVHGIESYENEKQVKHPSGFLLPFYKDCHEYIKNKEEKPDDTENSQNYTKYFCGERIVKFKDYFDRIKNAEILHIDFSGLDDVEAIGLESKGSTTENENSENNTKSNYVYYKGKDSDKYKQGSFKVFPPLYQPGEFYEEKIRTSNPKIIDSLAKLIDNNTLACKLDKDGNFQLTFNEVLHLFTGEQSQGEIPAPPLWESLREDLLNGIEDSEISYFDSKTEDLVYGPLTKSSLEYAVVYDIPTDARKPACEYEQIPYLAVLENSPTYQAMKESGELPQNLREMAKLEPDMMRAIREGWMKWSDDSKQGRAECIKEKEEGQRFAQDRMKNVSGVVEPRLLATGRFFSQFDTLLGIQLKCSILNPTAAATTATSNIQKANQFVLESTGDEMKDAVMKVHAEEASPYLQKGFITTGQTIQTAVMGSGSNEPTEVDKEKERCRQKVGKTASVRLNTAILCRNNQDNSASCQEAMKPIKVSSIDSACEGNVKNEVAKLISAHQRVIENSSPSQDDLLTDLMSGHSNKLILNNKKRYNTTGTDLEAWVNNLSGAVAMETGEGHVYELCHEQASSFIANNGLARDLFLKKGYQIAEFDITDADNKTGQIHHIFPVLKSPEGKLYMFDTWKGKTAPFDPRDYPDSAGFVTLCTKNYKECIKRNKDKIDYLLFCPRDPATCSDNGHFISSSNGTFR